MQDIIIPSLYALEPQRRIFIRFAPSVETQTPSLAIQSRALNQCATNIRIHATTHTLYIFRSSLIVDIML